MLRVIEGFEGFGTATGTDITTRLNEKYPGHGTGPYYLTAGSVAGYAICSASTGQDQWISLGTGLTGTTTTIVGFGFKAVSTTSVAVIYFFAGPGTSAAASLRWSTVTTGEFSVYNYAGSLLGTTSGAACTSGSGWHYVEVKVVVGTSGSVTINVDGVAKLTLTGVNTSDSAGDTYYICLNFDATSQYYLDDIYVCDTTGTYNNAFLGAQVVIGLLPTADTSQKSWTPSAGSAHYSLVNDNPSDDDTTYVQDGTSGDCDLYAYAQLANVATIAGIQINTVCRQTDTTAFSLKTAVKSGTTTSLDAGQSIGSTSYSTKSRIVETDPNTSAPWSETGLNAASIGIQVA
jgi:hypothetical protein